MRSKHLSVRKCIDKKPDKIKGIVCICIILAVVCAGNMIPNYLISLKAAKIAKTSTTISNADISPTKKNPPPATLFQLKRGLQR